jgi:hypothetical protein
MIKRPLQIGDVVMYERPSGVTRIGIFKKQEGTRIWCHWRGVDDTRWEKSPCWVDDTNRSLRLHPDADRLWADYCAAVLRDEAEPL